MGGAVGRAAKGLAADRQPWREASESFLGSKGCVELRKTTTKRSMGGESRDLVGVRTGSDGRVARVEGLVCSLERALRFASTQKIEEALVRRQKSQ